MAEDDDDEEDELNAHSLLRAMVSKDLDHICPDTAANTA